MNKFLNYSVTHPYEVTEYRRNGMIPHIDLDELYISEPEAQIRAGGCFSLGPKINTDTRNAIVKWTSVCRMQHNDKCYGISHESRIGRII